jgi:hypothetical protein
MTRGIFSYDHNSRREAIALVFLAVGMGTMAIKASSTSCL